MILMIFTPSQTLIYDKRIVNWYDKCLVKVKNKWLCRKPLLSGRPNPEDVDDGGLNVFGKFLNKLMINAEK